jgi:hypothetical protein
MEKSIFIYQTLPGGKTLLVNSEGDKRLVPTAVFESLRTGSVISKFCHWIERRPGDIMNTYQVSPEITLHSRNKQP